LANGILSSFWLSYTLPVIVAFWPIAKLVERKKENIARTLNTLINSFTLNNYGSLKNHAKLV